MVGWLPPTCHKENQNKDCCYKSQENIWETPISKKTLDFLNQAFPKEDKDNRQNNRNQSYEERKARREKRRAARRTKQEN